jgi:DcmR-like sensory protein
MSPRAPSPWKEILANPGPDGHIVQLYQDDEFYGEAIAHFAAEGLAKGESIILVATAPHWVNISGRLASRGFSVQELFGRGQLTLLDADGTLPKFIVNNMPDAGIFKGLARATIEKARAGGKFPRVRWWGEMVNVLYVNGNGRGSTRLEELFGEVGREESVPVFCSFLMDKFDPKIYDGPLGDVCRTHAHLIPIDDEVRHRDIVDRAVAEVFGKIEGPLLRSMISQKARSGPVMPPSQALLLCLKEMQPHRFGDVLAAARKHEGTAGKTP